ncbi:MAG: hypothetical protein FJY67_01690 [Calditrichaeota bacterium]|nr:hypothetical protein [Calditrichota bacterium]
MTIVAGIGLAVLSGSECNTRRPPPTGPLYGIDIALHGFPPEVDINTNIPLRGEVRDGVGEIQRGVRVWFSVTPDSVGQVTSTAVTEPDSATGFATQVIFIGRKEGNCVIKGALRDAQNRDSFSDTINVRVRDPING